MTAEASRPSRAVRRARVALIAIGAVLVGVGAGLFSAGVPVGQWPAVLLWLAGAVIVHDALLSPVLLVLGRLLRRAGRRIPWGAVAVVEVALVVAAVLALVALPGVAAQSIGARNPSVLVFPYALHLAVAWAVLAAVAVACVLGVALVRARRRAART